MHRRPLDWPHKQKYSSHKKNSTHLKKFYTYGAKEYNESDGKYRKSTLKRPGHWLQVDGIHDAKSLNTCVAIVDESIVGRVLSANIYSASSLLYARRA